MGKDLGVFASDMELDRPDLNKCPDCGCFFATDHCPVCGKECPLHMRAGNRAPVKQRARKRSGNGRVSFISWYHSWWFIVFTLIVLAPVGVVLLLTSPYKIWKKVLVGVLTAVYLTVSHFGVGNLLANVEELLDPPVNTSLSKEEYLAKCEEVTPEQFYRAGRGYKDQFVSMKLRVVSNVTVTSQNIFYYTDLDYVCYLCEAEDGSDYKIILRDCLLDDPQRFIAGDLIVVYGEGAGDREVYDEEYNYITAPSLNMAYAVRK